jgi:pimeloyl-ACP methyl ester carboxylesterase
MTSAPALSSSRPRKKFLRWTVLLAVLALIAYCGFAVHTHLRAASLMLRVAKPKADDWLARYAANPVTIRDTTFRRGDSTLPARIYAPVGVSRPPAMVVIPGMHRLGIDEPRLMNFALAFAGHGVTVLTPSVPDIADYRLTPGSVDVVGESIKALRAETGAARVGVLGLSFAGGLALLAAADPRYADDTAFVAAIGAYDDLPRVLRFFATNQIEFPDHSLRSMQAHEYGPLVAVYAHPEAFFSAADAAHARIAIRYQLWEQLDRSHAEAGKLSPEGQRLMKLLYEHHTETLAPTILANIDRYAAEMAPLSPHGRLAGMKVPVFLLHGAADQVIPPSETLWLRGSLPARCVRQCLISPVISHVEMGDKPKLKDELLLVHWMAAVLDEAHSSARPPR